MSTTVNAYSSCGVGFGRVMLDRRKVGCFGARGVAVGGYRRLAVDVVGGCRQRVARVDDVSKRRRQGLVGSPPRLRSAGLVMRAPVSRSAPTPPSWRSCLPVADHPHIGGLPVLNLRVPARATVRLGSKAEPRSGSECD